MYIKLKPYNRNCTNWLKKKRKVKSILWRNSQNNYANNTELKQNELVEDNFQVIFKDFHAIIFLTHKGCLLKKSLQGTTP